MVLTGHRRIGSELDDVTHHKTPREHGELPPSGHTQPAAPPVTLRRRLYEIMELGHGEDRASHVFDTALVILIVLNIAAFVAESVPKLQSAYGPQFAAFEYFSVAVFTILLAGIASATDSKLATATPPRAVPRRPARRAATRSAPRRRVQSSRRHVYKGPPASRAIPRLPTR